MAAVRKRRRPALSCEQCRRRKIRCDRSNPCEHCRSSNLDCSYDADKSIQLSNSWTSVFSLPKGPPPSHTQSVPVEGLSSNKRLQSQQSEYLHERRETESHPRSPLPTTDSRRESPCSWQGELKGVFSKNRYFGQSHWMNYVTPFRDVTKLILQHEADPSSDIHNLSQKCKAASREIKAQDKVLSKIASHPSDHVPPREIADKLVRSYLQTYESIYRIMHIPSFEREYDTYWVNPRMSSQALVTKLLLVMAIGTVFQPRQEAALLRSSALQWIYVAQTWVSTPFDKYRLTIEGLQIQCLLILARLTHDVDGDLLRLSAGSLLQASMQIGLHIDAELHVFKAISAQDIQLRRKIWATILEIVVQTSIDSGGVPLIRPTDYDCKPPLNVDDDAESHQKSAAFISSVGSQDEFTQSSLQIMLTKSLPLRLEIAAFVNDFRVDSRTYDKTMKFSERLLQTCTSDSTLFQAYRNSSRSPTDFQIYKVELLTHQYLFALHFPYAAKAKSDHTFYYSRKICLDTARLFLPDSSRMSDHSYTHLRLWGGGIFRAVPLQAAGFIAGELVYQVETSTTYLSKERDLLNTGKELRRYVEDYIELAITRIRLGHTNVKPYVMMSALLAHIDALKDGSVPEETITLSIKSGLSTCYEVLRELLNDSPRDVDTSEGDVHSSSGVNFNSAIWLSGSFTPQTGWSDVDHLANMDWWLFSGEMDNVP